MYETVKARFPHLSDEDQRNIAIFALECEKAEMQRTYDSIFSTKTEKELGF